MIRSPLSCLRLVQVLFFSLQAATVHARGCPFIALKGPVRHRGTISPAMSRMLLRPIGVMSFLMEARRGKDGGLPFPPNKLRMVSAHAQGGLPRTNAPAS